MRKLILIVILLVIAVAIAGCAKEQIHRELYASIVMPDGSIISGKCNAYERTDRYIVVYMDDGVYKANDWRVVIYEKR
jgi:hypothetical protein